MQDKLTRRPVPMPGISYAERQRGPARHLPGLAIVVVLHLVLGYALFRGLAQKVVEIVKAAPVEVTLLKEPPPPPPPPPRIAPPPRPVVARTPPQPAPPNPPRVYVPAPEVRVAPPPAEPTVAATSVAPPPSPPPAPAPAPAPAAPVVVGPRVDFASDCTVPDYPREAQEEGAIGETRLRVTVGAQGQVTDVQVTHSAGPTRAHKLMDRALVAAVRQTCHFTPGTVDGKPQSLSRDVTYVWKLAG